MELQLAHLVQLDRLPSLVTNRIARAADLIANSEAVLGQDAFPDGYDDRASLFTNCAIDPEDVAEVAVVTLVERPM